MCNAYRSKTNRKQNEPKKQVIMHENKKCNTNINKETERHIDDDEDDDRDQLENINRGE